MTNLCKSLIINNIYWWGGVKLRSQLLCTSYPRQSHAGSVLDFFVISVTIGRMKRNYELYELHEFRCLNFAAKAVDLYEYSYPFVTKLQNSIRNN